MKYGKITIAVALVTILAALLVFRFAFPTGDMFTQNPGGQQATEDNTVRAANFVVATSDSSTEDKQQADYVCDGVDDQVEINAAINALPDGGGKVLLLAGTYIVSDSVVPLSNTCLAGVGPETVIKVEDNLAARGRNWGVIESLGIEKSNIRIANLTIDGNRDNQTAMFHGVYYDSVSYWSVESCVLKDIRFHAIWSYRYNPYGVITHNTFVNNGSAAYIDNLSNHTVFIGNIFKQNQSGILVDNCEGVVISGNTFDFTGASMTGPAIVFSKGSLRGVVVNNSLEGGWNYGIFLHGSGTNQDARYHSVSNNVIKGFAKGIVIGAEADCEASYNSIVGNLIIQNGQEGIYLYNNAHHNLISGNYIAGNSQASNNSYDNICLAGNSDYNTIVGNTIRVGSQTAKPRYGINISVSTCNSNIVKDNDLDDSGATRSLNDAGTGTVIE